MKITEIEFIENYIVDSKGNHIKLNNVQKQFLEYMKKVNDIHYFNFI